MKVSITKTVLVLICNFKQLFSTHTHTHQVISNQKGRLQLDKGGRSRWEMEEGGRGRMVTQPTHLFTKEVLQFVQTDLTHRGKPVKTIQLWPLLQQQEQRERKQQLKKPKPKTILLHITVRRHNCWVFLFCIVCPNVSICLNLFPELNNGANQIKRSFLTYTWVWITLSTFCASASQTNDSFRLSEMDMAVPLFSLY